MKWRLVLWSGLGAAALVLTIGGVWIFTLPSAPAFAAAPPIAKEEAEATIAALKPPKRRRPLIAIVGVNDGSETTDYLMPYGILRRADVADVVALATQSGPVRLFPVLTVEPEATVADFDAQHPEGADYVIVPAMSRDDDPVVAVMDQEPGGQGCHHRRRLRRRQGRRQYRTARRQAGDHPLVLSEGVARQASRDPVRRRPAAGGRPRRCDDDRDHRVDADVAHPRSKPSPAGTRPRRSAAISALPSGTRVTTAARSSSRARSRLTAIGNTLAFWNREQLGIELAPGVDEVSLALVADAWSRTYRSRAVTFAGTADAQQTRNGLRILPDQVAAELARGATAAEGRQSCRRQKHWTRPFRNREPATACPPPTSSPCSSNTRGIGAPH